jgi:peptidoglycan/xylan/chitin deacetylase (PgdA/CDA1 family)
VTVLHLLRRTGWPLRAAATALLAASWVAPAALAADTCRGTLYLTLDTGNMRHAQDIAATLNKHGVEATFFLANEKTVRGDHALDASWAAYWRERAAEGHAFGSHTWRHGRLGPDLASGATKYRPQFGEDAGRTVTLNKEALCGELKRVDQALNELTGRELDALWRAPGGRVTPNSLAAARACGYAHVHWAEAGFLGDELPSDAYPNAALLARALRGLRDGDVLMAHLGIWSRQDPFAPMLDPLIAGLKQRGYCFRTLRDHPDYRSSQPAGVLAASAAKSPR